MTRKFARDARRALISDAELCQGAREAAAGQVVDLGGGSASELAAFRLLAKSYEALTAKHVADNLTARYLKEICRDQA